MGILAMVSLAVVCVVESSVLVNPGQNSWAGWVIFISFMIALNAPSIVLAMWTSTRSGVATGLTVIIYLILSCWKDISIAITDFNSPSYAALALLVFYPIVRPIPLIALLGVGYAVNRFHTA